MSKDTVVFNVGGTKFQIQRSLVQSYPNSYLAALANSSEGQEIFVEHNPLAFSVILDFLRYKRLMVPKNVAQEVVELQLREFGIPYDNLTEVIDDEELPSYAATIGNSSLRDTVLQASTRRMDTLISDVILPYLKRHAKRGHRHVIFYLTPNSVTQKNLTSELDNINDPHEWIHLPSRNEATEKEDQSDLPDLQFLLQKDQLKRLGELITKRSGVKNVEVSEAVVSCRTENEFGLLFSKLFDIIEIKAIIM
ncbi:141_t:CDS:2 [Dentiscutata heterogama]|uniref:141_t:CDS:1 n=1 Tax=Dentiscutata heterogama TaxID=1316150 RepID=A0ACA9M9G8_9GLOM|nr:141_t:CDS:2 [Dentiscutata heterogama]